MRPSIKMLSLIPSGIPVSGMDSPRAILSSAFFASSRASFSHTSKYACIPCLPAGRSPSRFAMFSRYAFVSSSAENSFSSNAFRAFVIVRLERSMLLSARGRSALAGLSRNYLLHGDAVPFTRGRGFEKFFRIDATFVRIFIRPHHIAKCGRVCLRPDICLLDSLHKRQNIRNFLFKLCEFRVGHFEPRELRERLYVNIRHIRTLYADLKI